MPSHALQIVLRQLDNAAREAGRPRPRLLAVSKHQPATAVAELSSQWRVACPAAGSGAQTQPAFGENYVHEAMEKRAALAHLALEWHLIGHLQSNKARDAAMAFDWVQTVDRSRIADALARHRSPERQPLNVLIQVNIDEEPGKHGCHAVDVPTLASAILSLPRLNLRGLMAIPAPFPDIERRRAAFARMKRLFDTLQATHPAVDTLSMGMSGDFQEAIAEGATMVRVGTALFGARPPYEARP